MIQFSKEGLVHILSEYGEDELAQKAPELDDETIKRIGNRAMDFAVEGMRIERSIACAATEVLAGREPKRKRRINKKG